MNLKNLPDTSVESKYSHSKIYGDTFSNVCENAYEKPLVNFDSSDWLPLKWLWQKAEGCMQRKDFLQAIPMYQKMLVISRGNSPGKREIRLYCHLCLAEIFEAKEDFSRLRKNFLLAIELEPDQAELRFQLAEALVRLEHKREALASYRAACERDPENVLYVLNYAICLRDLGRLHDAGQAFRKAIQGKPQDVRVLQEFALYLMDCGDFSQARKVLEKAIEISPDDQGLLTAFNLLKFVSEQKKPKLKRVALKNPIPSRQQESLGQLENSTRLFQDGFSFVFRDDVHWVDEDDRKEEYQGYLSKEPTNPLPFIQWRHYDDELVRLYFWSSQKDLSPEEQNRQRQLESILRCG